MSYGSAIQEAGARRRPVAWFLWLLASSAGLSPAAAIVVPAALIAVHPDVGQDPRWFRENPFALP